MGEPRAPEVAFDDFLKVDIRVGRIVEAEDFPEARRPAWKLRVDFGPDIGVRRSSAQIANYPREDRLGRLVLGVVNFPPRQVGPVRSGHLYTSDAAEARTSRETRCRRPLK